MSAFANKRYDMNKFPKSYDDIFMFWGKNMSNNGVFSIIVCTFASK